MKTIFEVTDPLGQRVILTEQAWQHICAGHMEVEPYQAALHQVVEQPEVIMREENGEVHYSRLHVGVGRLWPLYLKVLVRRQSRHLLIVTAWFDPLPGDGEVLWVSKR